MIKTGLVGHGYWGKILESKLDIVSNKFFVQNTSNYNPALFDNIQWLFVATPPKTHFQIAKDAIEKGINVFLEKPFCANYFEANNLVELAKKNNINLYIDNIFLHRKELKSFNNSSLKRVTFIWYKFGPFNDYLINDLLYHDLNILYQFMGEREIKKITVRVNKNNILKFSFLYGDTLIEFDYNRNQINQKLKKIIADDVIIQFENNNEDPLLSIIDKCIHNNLDYINNNILNLKTKKIFEIISNTINKYN